MEGEILAGLERGQRTAIVRLEVKSVHVVALRNFFEDGKFADAVPAGLGFGGGLAAEFGFNDLRAEFFGGDFLLDAFAIEPEQGAEDFDGQPCQQPREQGQPADAAQAAVRDGVKRINQGCNHGDNPLTNLTP